MSKIFWFDTETTGLNPKLHDIVQLAYIIEIDGKEKEEGEILMRPAGKVDADALAVHGRSAEEIEKYPEARKGVEKLVNTLGKYVDRYDKKDKFIAAGYNVSFDMDMLRSTFTKVGEKYFGSWFFWPTLDVSSWVALSLVSGRLEGLPDFKLKTLCEKYDISINAHEALSDIRATKELYTALSERIGVEKK